ncbi:uncharacterized protein LOC128236780 [Mya arenaria]|uniref:uncharacterized protein LOC128236780 n=1 Tax=Mya arenaria TaxID=6604 RepID=UPI0022E86845|nr:uncharacterized protein LOC128236780 [Mya arenaria]
MNDYKEQFSNPRSRNWLKGSVALNITQQGLAPFACKVCDDIRVKKLKIAIGYHFPDLCGNCSIVEVIPCDPKNNICNTGQCRFHKRLVFRPCLIVKCNDYRNTVADKIQKGIDIGCNSCRTAEIVQCDPGNRVCISGTCKFHMDPNTELFIRTRPCPNNICDTLRNAIQQTHRFKNPSWKNTDAREWCVNAWDIAKCFMPPDGYADVDNENKTDLNGIISVFINCEEFQKYFTADLSSRQNICAKVRDVGKNIRHAPGLEVTDDDLKVWLADLKALFSDPTFNKDNPLAKDAIDQLQQLEKDEILIERSDVAMGITDSVDYLQTLTAAHSTLKLQSRIDDLKVKVQEIPKQMEPSGMDKFESVTKADIGEEQKRWLIVGLCLNDVVSPPLRTYVGPIVEAEYQKFKNEIEAQQFPNYLKQYPPTNQDMNYRNINNNAQLLKVNDIPDWAKFDYRVKNAVDFSKLFVKSEKVHYKGFDNTCDQRTLLKIIEKMHLFPQPIKTVADKIRLEVRNQWAHVDFKEWDTERYEKCFELMTQVIKEMKPSEEKEIIDQLTYWKSNGMQFVSGQKTELELLESLTEKTKALTIYIKRREKTSDDKFETCINALTKISFSLDKYVQRQNENHAELESRVNTHDAMLKQHSKFIDVISALNRNQLGQKGVAASKGTIYKRELVDRFPKLEAKQLPHETETRAELDPECLETNANHSNIASTSSFISEKAVYDAVLLYAADDLEIAKKVLADLRTVSDEYKIDLFNNLPLANHDHFHAMEYVIAYSRYLLIIATERFSSDVLANYQFKMALYKFIESKEQRVVPIRLGQRPVTLPMELNVIKGLRYYSFDQNKCSDNTKDFIEGFKRLMQNENIRT